MAAVGSECCPHCAMIVVPDAPLPFGAVACGSCGRPLWFLTIDNSLAFFRHLDAPFVRELFAAIRQGQTMPAHLAFDKFDILELMSEFEEALESAR